MGWLGKAVSNKKVITERIDRDSNYAVTAVFREQDPSVTERRIWLGERPDGLASPDYVESVADETMRKLGEWGIEGWAADLEASREASQLPNRIGYGNEGNMVWAQGHHYLVVARKAVATQAELATVHVLPVQREPIEPIAA